MVLKFKDIFEFDYAIEAYKTKTLPTSLTWRGKNTEVFASTYQIKSYIIVKNTYRKANRAS